MENDLRKSLAMAIPGFDEMTYAQQEEAMETALNVAQRMGLSEEDLLKYGCNFSIQDASTSEEGKALNAEEIQICRMLGVSIEDYCKAKLSEANSLPGR